MCSGCSQVAEPKGDPESWFIHPYKKNKAD